MNKLNQAIEENNITDIRNILKAYMTSDPTDSNKQIQTILEEIANKEVDIWEEHDRNELNLSSWSEEDFLDLQVDLRMNFSRERFMHMLDVGKEVYGSEKNTDLLKMNRNSAVNSTATGSDQPKKSQTMSRGIVAIAVGVLVILIWKMISSNT